MNNIYNEGFAAFTDGKDYSDNPYRHGSKQSSDWSMGWVSASSENDRDEDFLGGDEEEDNMARYQDWINE
jgi:hypothetical protein